MLRIPQLIGKSFFYLFIFIKKEMDYRRTKIDVGHVIVSRAKPRDAKIQPTGGKFQI